MYVNVPHVNKAVTDFGVYIPIYTSLRPWCVPEKKKLQYN